MKVRRSVTNKLVSHIVCTLMSFHSTIQFDCSIFIILVNRVQPLVPHHSSLILGHLSTTSTIILPHNYTILIGNRLPLAYNMLFEYFGTCDFG